MVKGWDTNENGTYYFDTIYGTMTKGWNDTENGSYYFDPAYGTLVKGGRVMDGVSYKFDETTGALIDLTQEVVLKDGEQITQSLSDVTGFTDMAQLFRWCSSLKNVNLNNRFADVMN